MIYIVKKKNLNLFGKIAMFIISVLWGASFFIQKNTLDRVSVLFLLFFRFGAGALLLAICFFPKFKKFNKSYLSHGFMAGLLLFLAYVAQTYGLAYTTPGKNAFLTAVYCVIVPFIMWIITKKRPSLRYFLAAIICTGGIGLISIDGNSLNLGDAITLICAVFYALQMVYICFFIKDKDLILFSIVQFATVAVLSLIAWAIFDRSVPVSWDGNLIWSLVYVVVCSTVLGFLTQNFGQQHVSAESSALILSLESVFGVLFSVLIYGEQPSVPGYIGFAVVFLGVIVSEVDFKKIIEKMRHKGGSPTATDALDCAEGQSDEKENSVAETGEFEAETGEFEADKNAVEEADDKSEALETDVSSENFSEKNLFDNSVDIDNN